MDDPNLTIDRRPATIVLVVVAIFVIIAGWVHTRVKQIGDDVHLLSMSAATGPPIVAYRVGFDFVPDERDASSALAPANFEPDTTAWFQLDQRLFNWLTVPANINGEFVLTTASAPFLWKSVPSKPGQFEQAVIQVEQLAGQAPQDGRIVSAGVASVLLTNYRQRLGDMAADTIVIDARYPKLTTPD